MSNDYFNPPNSIWPNGLKKDDEGYVVFYPLGTNKVDISTVTWPTGDTLISPFVYQNDKLVGFVDTKAFIVSGNTTTTMDYSHIEADFASIKEGTLTINAPNATVKEFKWETTIDGGNSGDTIVLGTKYLGCKTVEEVKAIDPTYKTTDIVEGVWNQSLTNLENGCDSNYTGLFDGCENLISFNSDLSSLTDGTYMFYGCSNLNSFSSNLPSMTIGDGMFEDCTNLESFSADYSGSPVNLSNLTDGNYMFAGCENLKSFSSDLSSLIDAYRMFYHCTALTSFSSDLSSLTYGYDMFSNCKLDTVSVQNIANTINTYSETIHVGIGNSSPNEQEVAAFNTIASKGWTVLVNGSEYTPTSPAVITTLDETGEEITTPIPFWAKLVQSDEEHAQYIDNEGNFFNILGGQFIYGDDLSTYGMFTCEEDAAANMRLTPYIKPQTEIENQ